MSPESAAGTLDSSAFGAHLLRRWWLVLVQAVVITVAVVAVLGIRDRSDHERTVHFVLHPASTLAQDQVLAAIDGLRPDGSLLQTVLHVLDSDQLLHAVARAAIAGPVDQYSLGVTLQTGSAFFDVTVKGPDGIVVANLASHMRTVAPDVIQSLYTSYSLDVTGTDGSDHTAFPPSPDVVVLALLLGVTLGVALSYVEWWLIGLRRASAPPVVVESPPEESTTVDSGDVIAVMRTTLEELVARFETAQSEAPSTFDDRAQPAPVSPPVGGVIAPVEDPPDNGRSRAQPRWSPVGPSREDPTPAS